MTKQTDILNEEMKTYFKYIREEYITFKDVNLNFKLFFLKIQFFKSLKF